MEQIWDRRVRRQGRRRAVARIAAAMVVLGLAGLVWAGAAYVIVHLPEILGHAAGTAVRAYNESAH